MGSSMDGYDDEDVRTSVSDLLCVRGDTGAAGHDEKARGWEVGVGQMEIGGMMDVGVGSEPDALRLPVRGLDTVQPGARTC